MHTIHAQSLADVVAGVPYLLGYQPAGTVLVGFRGPRLESVSASPEPGAQPETECVAQALEAFTRAGVDRVLILGYPDVVIGAYTAVLSSGMEVLDCGNVTGDRFLSLLSRESVDLTQHAAAVVALVALGRAPYRDRAAFVARFDADPVPEVGQTLAVTDMPDPQTAAQAWREVLDPAADGLDVGTLALAVTALRDVQVRDGIIHAMIGRETMPGLPEHLAHLDVPLTGCPDVADRLATLDRVATMTLGHDRANVLTVAAVVHWDHGDHTSASAAASAALTADPTHRLAGLVHQLVTRGIRGPRA